MSEMQDKNFQVIFTGNIEKGFDKINVQRSFSRLIDVSFELAEKLFDGQRHILKAHLSHNSAVRFRDRFLQVGALLEVEHVFSALELNEPNNKDNIPPMTAVKDKVAPKSNVVDSISWAARLKEQQLYLKEKYNKVKEISQNLFVESKEFVLSHMLNDHFVILGWNENKVRYLLFACEKKHPKTQLVLLCKEDKEQIHQALEKISTFANEVIVRQGDYQDERLLKTLSLHKAKAVFVVQEKPTGQLDGLSETIFKLSKEKIKHLQFYQDFDSLEWLIARSSHSVNGLKVYREIFSSKNSRFEFIKGGWKGFKFEHLLYRFADAVPIAIIDESNQCELLPDSQRIMTPGETLVLLCPLEADINFIPEGVAKVEKHDAIFGTYGGKKQKDLILGYNDKTSDLINLLDHYEQEVRWLDVCIEDKGQGELVKELGGKLNNAELQLLDKDPSELSQLKQLQPYKYDNVFILADSYSEKISSLLNNLKTFYVGHEVKFQNTNIIAILPVQFYKRENDNHRLQVIDAELFNAELNIQSAIYPLFESFFKNISDIKQNVFIDVVKVKELYSNLPDNLRFIDLTNLLRKESMLLLGLYYPDKKMIISPNKSERFTFLGDTQLVILRKNDR